MADWLRQQSGARCGSAAELARRLGVEVVSEEWRTVDDRLLYLAECQIDPPRITLNARALPLLAARAGIAPAHLTQLAIAHELYHILTRQPSCARGDVERAAHQFAEAVVGYRSPVAGR